MSEELEALSDHIDEQAEKAQSTSADSVSVTRRSLTELDNHYDRKANRDAAANGGLGVRFFNLKPHGAVSRGCS